MHDDQPSDEQTGRSRGPDGRFTRSMETAERDAEAARLRSRGWSYRDIAAHLDLVASSAYDAVKRALAATVEEPAADVRRLETEKLDRLERAAWEVMEADHLVIQQGKVVHRNGQPIRDDAPVLKAVETILRVAERRARLWGLDAPVKANIEVTPVDPADLALTRILEEARAKNEAEEAALGPLLDGSER